MKTADLKAGELYAVRHIYEPCLLMSTAVYERRSGRMGPERWALAKAGTKPHRDQPKFHSQGRIDYGFVVLAGPADALTGADRDSILRHLVEHGESKYAVPEGTSIQMVFSAVAFTGEYARVQEEQRARKDAETARKQKRVDEYNAVVDGLNAMLGDMPLERVEVGWDEPPTGVKLTLGQARRVLEAARIDLPPMADVDTGASIEDRRRRIKADAEDAKKALRRAQAHFEGLCNELAALRREELEA